MTVHKHADPVTQPIASDAAVQALLARLVDALDDRAADVVDERLAAAMHDSGPLARMWRRSVLGLALGSLALGVAATVVVASHPLVVTVIWVAIAIVNVGYARRL